MPTSHSSQAPSHKSAHQRLLQGSRPRSSSQVAVPSPWQFSGLSQACPDIAFFAALRRCMEVSSSCVGRHCHRGYGFACWLPIFHLPLVNITGPADLDVVSRVPLCPVASIHGFEQTSEAVSRQLYHTIRVLAADLWLAGSD